jgi:predicted nucleotidyltransferase
MRILCKIIAGSHLFGTNTPKSDLDYKGVFIPSADDILMNTYKHTDVSSTNDKYGSKNTSEDIDLEMRLMKIGGISM